MLLWALIPTSDHPGPEFSACLSLWCSSYFIIPAVMSPWQSYQSHYSLYHESWGTGSWHSNMHCQRWNLTEGVSCRTKTDKTTSSLTTQVNQLLYKNDSINCALLTDWLALVLPGNNDDARHYSKWWNVLSNLIVIFYHCAIEIIISLLTKELT